MVALRLVWVQGVSAGQYAERARRQRLQDVQITPKRGTIYDREGEPLASSVEARTIYANPRLVRDKTGTSRVLAQVLGGKPTEYEALLSRDAGFVYIGRKVELTKARSLERLSLEGIGFIEDSRRLYPAGSLACQVLGFVGLDDHGLSGIEQVYDGMLAGEPGVLLAERDPAGREIPGGVVKSIEPVQGRDIVLTIDKDIQAVAQAELGRAVRNWRARGGSVVVMSPKTGEIYAMASTPYFDPNAFAAADADAFRNRALSDAYEPGSTLKALLAAAAIDARRFKPDTRISLPSRLRVGGRTIRESHGRAAVKWSLTEIVTNSSNVGAAKIGLALGASRLQSALKRFGLGQSTGVDFAGEATGWLPSASALTPLVVSTVSFGQGVSTTPLQLSRAVSALANRGLMPSPHFLLSQPEGGRSRAWKFERVVRPQTAAAATRMLQGVVTKGTGAEAKVPGYSVAGKTGTAQVARSDGRGYAGGVYNASFIGYLPANDPEVVICVVISAPRKGIYGGHVAAPTFAAIGRFCMEHLRVNPDLGLTAPAKHRTAGSKTSRPAKSKGTPPRRSVDETTSNEGVTGEGGAGEGG